MRALDAMLVAHGSIWDLEVILTFKSTFPIRNLLVPSFPQGGMLTWDLLAKKGNRAIGVSLENFYVKKVGFLFCRTSQNLYYVILCCKSPQKAEVI